MTSVGATQIEILAEDLAQISEQLADIALDQLRAARDGDEAALTTEKRVTRARRAVDKAAALLLNAGEKPADA